MRFRMLPAAAALTAALLLAGCVPSDPIITPEPVPDSTPVFASDEEALAAATETYGKYLAVSNAIRADGGESPERIVNLVTSDQYEEELSGFTSYAEKGLSTVGDITADSARLQQYVSEPDGSATVTMYVCLDATQVHVLDANGNIKDPSEGPGRQLFEISLKSEPDAPSALKLSGSELWPDQDNC